MRVAEVLLECGEDVELIKAKMADMNDLEADLLILACPTYGHGELEQYFQEFLDQLEEVNLEGRKCAVIGLGDTKYEMDYHLESVKVISDFLKRKKAVIVGMPLRISKSPYTFLNDYVVRWAETLSKKIHE